MKATPNKPHPDFEMAVNDKNKAIQPNLLR